MNKLPNTVVAFARRGCAHPLTSRSARPMNHRIPRDAGALVCRWHRDSISHKLRCAWSFEVVERDLEERSRLRLAG
jgi:hypothetical protein